MRCRPVVAVGMAGPRNLGAEPLHTAASASSLTQPNGRLLLDAGSLA